MISGIFSLFRELEWLVMEEFQKCISSDIHVSFKDDLTLRERKKNLLELIRNSKVDTLKSLFPGETFLSVRKNDSTVQLHQYYFTMPSHRWYCKRCAMLISWWIWSSNSSKYHSSALYYHFTKLKTYMNGFIS